MGLGPIPYISEVRSRWKRRGKRLRQSIAQRADGARVRAQKQKLHDHCSGWWRRRFDKTAAKPGIAVVDAAECRVTNLLASRGVAALRLTSAWVGRCPE